ncbi:hypothetical protein [Wolbachia endosymbiont (group A) of Chalcis sispes]|uniref:hypothetical protein n=1 Tax=Wolbachia endosymbiont (group A) of Chalcis sispes TaxID=3066197 RepID=UPI003132C4E2
MDTHITFMPIISATKAFKELGKDGMCLYEMEDDDYQSVFVRTCLKSRRDEVK